MLKLKGFYRTDAGLVRPHNEDRLCVVPAFPDNSNIAEISVDKGKGILLAVADGMGGSNAGEIAAEIAIDTVKSSTEKIDSILLRPTEIGLGLESIIYKAHLNIKAALNEENTGMGTTLILALITGDKVHVAWCGDSRAYKYSSEIMERKNKYDLPHLKILTRDHSVVWQMVMKGKLDPNQAREHELSNVITQSLGDTSNDPKPESAMYTIAPGDKILVCSDGLNSMLPDEFIQEILAHNDPVDELGNSLLEAANTAGGLDNITLILAQIESVPETALSVIKPIKTRPEAITAKSGIGDTIAGSFVFKNWIMKEIVLIPIIVVACIFLFYQLNIAFKFGERNNPVYEQPNKTGDLRKVDTLKSNSFHETILNQHKDSIMKMTDTLQTKNKRN